jgi:hypothetical protein
MHRLFYQYDPGGTPPAKVMSVKRCLAIVLFCLGSLAGLHGATLERLSLDEMIAKSTSVVRGTVTASWSTFTGRDIFTHYRISVDESFKGDGKKTVEIQVHGGTYGAYHQTTPGSPVLNQGDQYVFFLWTSNAGVTWITGMTQGLFQLNGGEATDRLATRAASRELMLDPATARPVKESEVSMKLSDLRARIGAGMGKGGAK